MHVYIYDNFVLDKSYYKDLVKVETRLTDLGLNGKIIRLNVVKNLTEVVENEIKMGAKTIIGVGDDQTLSKIVNAYCLYQEKNKGLETPLSLIPLTSKNLTIATCLGLEEGERACNVLSARRIESLDIGKANSLFFISNVRINSNNTLLNTGKGYSIETESDGEIIVLNLPENKSSKYSNIKSSPQDERLDLRITTKPKKNFFRTLSMGGESLFLADNLEIYNKNSKAIVDNFLEMETPLNIKLAENKVNFIIGKNRLF